MAWFEFWIVLDATKVLMKLFIDLHKYVSDVWPRYCEVMAT